MQKLFIGVGLFTAGILGVTFHEFLAWLFVASPEKMEAFMTGIWLSSGIPFSQLHLETPREKVLILSVEKKLPLTTLVPSTPLPAKPVTIDMVRRDIGGDYAKTKKDVRWI